jgi:hypothetical protein
MFVSGSGWYSHKLILVQQIRQEEIWVRFAGHANVEEPIPDQSEAERLSILKGVSLFSKAELRK